MSAARRGAWGIALLLLGLGGGWAARSLAAPPDEDPYGPLDTLVRALGLVQASYVDEVPTDRLVDAALRGMVGALDPHSRWLDAEAWRDAQREADGTRAGLGLEVRFTDAGAEVVRVLPGGPAERDGVEVGDVLLAVDGAPLDAARLQSGEGLAGPRGEPVELTLRRAGAAAPLVLRTVRDLVRVVPVEAGVLAPGVAYARVAAFPAGAAADLERALTGLSASPGFTALVLDLRDNPGGLLEEAVGVADLFLADGPIVRTEGRAAGARAEHRARPGAWTGSVVVLVDGRTASAAEIVAAALQDTGRARLVGTTTFGKGTVQTVFEHKDGSALRLTVARYLTPSGRPVARHDGRAPDVVVPWPGEGSAADRLRVAIDALDVPEASRQELGALVDALPHAELRTVRSPLPWDLPLRERLEADPQLQAALAELRR